MLRRNNNMQKLSAFTNEPEVETVFVENDEFKNDMRIEGFMSRFHTFPVDGGFSHLKVTTPASVVEVIIDSIEFTQETMVVNVLGSGSPIVLPIAHLGMISNYETEIIASTIRKGTSMRFKKKKKAPKLKILTLTEQQYTTSGMYIYYTITDLVTKEVATYSKSLDADKPEALRAFVIGMLAMNWNMVAVVGPEFNGDLASLKL
jgi:hypothetical protein